MNSCLRRTVSIRNILVLLIVLALLPACATNPVTGKSELMLMSESAELRMGDDIYPSAMWGEIGGGGRYRDPRLEKYLGDIVMKLHSNSHRPQLPMTFEIQNSSVPNAWAIPGHVTMTRGLLAGLDNEAQFAFVMGHEIGHVSARHSARQFSAQVLQGLILLGGTAMLEGENADWLISVGAVGSTLLLLKYSRANELQSDRLGVRYMAASGYRPEEARSAHLRLKEAADKYLDRIGRDSPSGNLLAEILSTHPEIEDRLNEVDTAAAAAATGPHPLDGNGVNRNRFRSMISPLVTVNRAYIHYDKAYSAFEKKDMASAEKHLNDALWKNYSQAPFHNLKGRILTSRGNYGAALESFQMALRYDPGYQPAFQGLGYLSYKRGHYKAAIEHAERSLEIFPANPVSHFIAGMSRYKLQQYSEAVDHLRVFSRAAPKHKEVHGVLGISLEALYDYADAYGEYLIQIRLDPYSELGRHARTRANALRPRVDPPRQDEGRSPQAE